MPKKALVNLVIVVAVVAAIGGVLVLKNRPAREAASPAVEQPAPIKQPEEEVGSEKLPTLVDLGASKCIPCKKMAPILDELKAEYAGKMKIVFHDVWKDPEPAKEYAIRLIPTQVFLDPEGKELFRHEGFLSKEDILAKWRESGFDLAPSNEWEMGVQRMTTSNE